MQTLYIKLNGLTSLLMNNPEKTLASSEAETGATKGAVKQLNPEEQAKIRRYLLPDGNFYVPATAVRKCLLTASTGYTAKSETGRRRAVRPTLSSALILTDPAFPLLDEDEKPISGDSYKLNTQRVVIAQTKASIWRGRPEIWPWKLLCWFNFDPRRIGEGLELIRQIADDAGSYPGLLDGRPEKGLWFGRFEVTDIWSE